MAPRKQSGPVGTGRQNTTPTRQGSTAENGRQARADERHGAALRLLALVRDPVVVAIGLTEAAAIRHSLPLAACRSAALILVLQRPDLAREPKQLAEEAALLISGLLEVVDDGGSDDVEVDRPYRFARRPV